MIGRFLSAAERKKAERFPEEVSLDDCITYFTLDESDMAQLPQKSAGYNRLGFALQLCNLRFLGFCPNDLEDTPPLILDYVSGQTGADPQTLKNYGQREQTRTEHFQKIMDYLGFRKAGQSDSDNLLKWLTERALEHDKPTLLLRMAFEKLYSEKIVRPGITSLERMVAAARNQARKETYRKLKPLLTDDLKLFLDTVLEKDRERGRTPLFWLRFGATANTSAEILSSISKIEYLRRHKADRWDLSPINPNRRKFLARIGRYSTNQSLKRAVPEKRYPVLIAFLQETYREVIDELVELFDRCLGDCHTRAKNDLKDFRLSVAKSANEKLKIFNEIGNLVVNENISDEELRTHIFRLIPEEAFRNTLNECRQIIRPGDDHAYDFLGNRYSYIRTFAPSFLKTLHFRSNRDDHSLVDAVELLKCLDSEGERDVPEGSPSDFIGTPWLPYIRDDEGKTVRKYYEISTLWHLRSAMRSGDIWIEGSRRYADPESYLIPQNLWTAMRTEACQTLGLSENGKDRLIKRQNELEAVYRELDEKIKKCEGVRIEKGDLIVSPLNAEQMPEDTEDLQNLISERLPRIDLPDLLIEVDRWVGFSTRLTHSLTHKPANREFLPNLYASLIAQTNNYGLKKMAEISGLSYERLVWCTNWFLREETLQNAINALVNYQFHLPLASDWGGGTMSSSDGQRFPVPIRARNAKVIPKYGYGRILTYYSWTSDQLSQWKSRPAPSMVRDATYVLDGMIDNETELPLYEHTTDTAGYTELIFAFFDLLGFMFSPRIRDLGDQNIYCIDKSIKYENLNNIIKGTVKTDQILKNWDTMLRVAASIRFGWVTASLFVGKLQSQKRKSTLAKAFLEYGRLIKSIYIPRYICREDQQRKVSLQLNKGEALHSLRRWLLFAEGGQIRKSQLQDQINQASTLTLVTNAIIVWNTRYMQAAIEQLETEGYKISDESRRHLSPCRFEHINKYGRLTFNVEKELKRQKLRGLRNGRR